MCWWLAGLHGGGEVTKWTASKCAEAGEKLCKSGSSLEALHLPWHSELVTVEGKVRVVLVSGGSGTPGFKEKCKTMLGSAEDECVAALVVGVGDVVACRHPQTTLARSDRGSDMNRSIDIGSVISRTFSIYAETQLDGHWTAIRLWDNAHDADQHHEHEYTSSQGKRDPTVQPFTTVNQAMAAAMRRATEDWPTILENWRSR